MPYYSFICQTKRGRKEFDKQMSFKEFDEHKAGNLKVECELCHKCAPDMVMGGVGVFIYDSTPKTIGTLAERNSKYRIPEAEAEQQKKDEERKKKGKFVPNRKPNRPWDAPTRKNIDDKEILKERKEKKREHVAKFNKNKS